MFPYLLRGLTIDPANPVWSMDITYIPMRKGFVYLTAVRDWGTRQGLAWRLSNTLTTDFCLEAVEEAVRRYGPPEIFNTDSKNVCARGSWAACPQQRSTGLGR